MKKRKVSLIISSYIERDDDSEKIMFAVDGTVEDDGERVSVKYTEPGGESIKPTKNEISFEKSHRKEITLTRRGGLNSLMLFEVGKRYTWQYDVGFMSMDFCTSTLEISNTASFDGGDISIYYIVENCGMELQRVRFKLTIK